MDEEIRILIKGVLGHFVGRRQDFEVERPRCREAVNAMTRAVCEVLEVHRPKYTEMVSDLGDSFPDAAMVNVAKSLFEDGIINWGRVVSLICLGAAVCQHQDRFSGSPGSLLADTVSEAIASYLLTEHRGWLEEMCWVSGLYSRGLNFMLSLL
uniref:Mcl1-like n=1 Tax=Oryzias latipes TaxID=8090 RepID=A0A286P9S2_ORYLA|nr:mcl1-like [Oryzias latipes]